MPTKPTTHKPLSTQLAMVRAREAKQHRPSTTARGYNGEWKRLRAKYLAEHPWCECDECKGSSRPERAQVVDHIQTIDSRPDLRLAWSNLRAMSKRHHDRRTAREQAFGRNRA